MSVFVFEFEKGFNLACLPQDMEVEFPFGVFVKFCYEFPTFKFISPTKWKLNADFCSFIKPMDWDNRLKVSYRWVFKIINDLINKYWRDIQIG